MVVGHPGHGNMVDVQFSDVSFVERREAGRLTPVRTNPTNHTRATVEAIYERLVTEHLGKKAFRNAKGERIDVLALNKGTLSREEVNDLVGRAFAIANSRGPGKASKRDRERLEDYEQTLVLRRVVNPRMPLRRNFIGAALRAGGAAVEAGTAAFRSAARVAPVAAREAGVIASEGRALAETGAVAARESFRTFLKTPQGKAFAAQITTTVTALFGAEVARRASLTPEQTALVQRTLSRKAGEEVDPELISAAIRSSKRK
jgi:hypothetical protein